jgi:hypothetical protein
MKYFCVPTLLALVSVSSANATDKEKHLFILSGQSNMARLDPSISITPALEKAFGKGNVVVVKDAQKGQPISRWYKKWKPAQGEVYAASLKGLIVQLSEDLKRDEINVVIGRLSDAGITNDDKSHWTMVRKAQVEVAEAYPRGAWVDTDDLNDGKNEQGKQITNDLHYSVEGYKTLGERFAQKSIDLIKKNAP